MKKVLISIFALGLLIFSAAGTTSQDVTVAQAKSSTKIPIQPPV